jgi:uncharacterized protein (TIGR02246 family)
MRKPQGAFVLVVLVCVVCAYPSAGAQSPAAAAEIAQVSDAYVKASLAADAKAIAALYTEDAVEMPPNHPMVKGRTAIEQYYTKQFGGSAKLQSLALTRSRATRQVTSAMRWGRTGRPSPMGSIPSMTLASTRS